MERFEDDKGNGLLRRIWQRIYSQNILILRLTWRKPNSTRVFARQLIVERLVTSLLVILRSLSLSNISAIFPSNSGRLNFIDLYVVSWFLLLFLAFEIHVAAPVLASILCFYRITDIISYQLSILLVDSRKPAATVQSIQRSVIMALINLAEIIASFAIIHLSLSCVVSSSGGEEILGFWKMMYFSMVTTTTLGYGEFVPGNDTTRNLVLLQMTVSLLFLAVLVPILSSTMTEFVSRQKDKAYGEARRKS